MSTCSPKQIKYYLALLLLGISFSTQAIVIRHDKADSRYRVEENDYPQVFFLHTRLGNKICVATLISPQWALTAAHCTDQTPIKEALERAETYSLYVAGRPHKIVSMVVHPDYQHAEQAQAVDLALIKLDRVVRDVEPVQLYSGFDEQDQVLSFLGWGYTGIGTLGRQNNDGELRRAKNTVIRADQWLQFYFDDPREQGSQALDLEGVPGLGDSGGPALLENEGGLHIVGVALGEVAGPEGSQLQQGHYGAIELYERVSSHLAWINRVISENNLNTDSN